MPDALFPRLRRIVVALDRAREPAHVLWVVDRIREALGYLEDEDRAGRIRLAYQANRARDLLRSMGAVEAGDQLLELTRAGAGPPVAG